MSEKDLDGRLVFAEKQDFYREQVGLLQVIGSCCSFSRADWVKYGIIAPIVYVLITAIV